MRKTNNTSDDVPMPPDRLSADRQLALAEALRLRDRANKTIRAFFDERGFLEVETPNWVEAPGTDVHLDPVRATFEEQYSGHSAGQCLAGYLHTSPEFAMKRLIVEGLERIFQMCKVWRNGEITEQHNPEFTILEWYRAGEPVEAIIEDVEALSAALLGEQVCVDGRTIELHRPFERMTMQQVVEEACGFDLLAALDFDALLDACTTHELLSAGSLERARRDRRWDELFFELQITHIDPFLAERGAVFVTEWPAPLAVLARKKPGDARVAQRFELYVGGVELANGFQELTDAAEQRRRFEEDLAARRQRGLPAMPMPERFLRALERGLPDCSGVAVGVDRMLMLAAGVDDIREILPFAMRRRADSGAIVWG